MITSRISTIFFTLFLLITHRVVQAIEQPDFVCIHSPNQLIASEGFAAGTLIKTVDGYQPIESISPGCMVMAYDMKYAMQTERCVLFVQKVCISHCLHITRENRNIITGPAQKFYDYDQRKWIQARLFDAAESCIDSQYLYQLYVEVDHNFYVTESDILVHNVVPVVFFGTGFATTSAFAAFCTAAAPVVAVGVPVAISGIVIWKIGAYVFAKNNGQNSGLKPSKNKRNDGPDDPDGPENGWKKKKNKKDDEERRKEYLKRRKKKERDEARANYRPLTNKEAREQAEKLGYKEDSNPPFDSLEKPTFRKGNDWITPDKYGHRGGVWKRFFKEQRIGTYDSSLKNRIGD